MRGTALPSRSLDWPIAWAGVELIARAETCRLVSYRCPAGIWTIGWGHTTGIKGGMKWSQQQCDQAFVHELTARRMQVESVLTAPASEDEIAAMVSLQYNIGDGAFRKSSVLKAHNRGDSMAAARAFGLWNKARVRGVLTVLPGLTARRSAEAALYLTPDDGAPGARMPQAVEPESTLAASPIAQTGVAVSTAGALVAAKDATEHAGILTGTVTAVRDFIGSLGIPPDYILPALAVIAGVVIVRYRLKQRRDGWA
jgi:lysozyme